MIMRRKLKMRRQLVKMLKLLDYDVTCTLEVVLRKGRRSIRSQLKKLDMLVELVVVERLEKG